MSNLESQIKKSIGLIHEYAPYAEQAGGYKVGFSGGKDSQVLYQIFKESGVNFTAIYNVTTNDPPENVRFIRSEYPDVEFSLPKLNFFDLAVKKKQLPTIHKRFCCKYLKEQSKGFYALGIRREESPKRKTYPVISLNNKKEFSKETYKSQRVRFYPIIEWNESEVWEFIDIRNIKVNPVYDTFGRVGCMLCPYANKKQWLYWFNKYPRLKIKMLSTIHKLRQNGSYDKLAEYSDEEILDWWMSKQSMKQYFSQLKLQFQN